MVKMKLLGQCAGSKINTWVCPFERNHMKSLGGVWRFVIDFV
jgi:hypothetical protein